MRRFTLIACIAGALIAPLAVAQDAESSIYGSATSCDALRSYLRAYPQGRFKANAEGRIAKECAAPTPAAATSPKPAPKPKPAAGDPCVAARADWTQVDGSQDIAILRGYVSGLPKACGTQRALAQAQVDALQKVLDDRKRVAWLGVPEFDGVWVLEAGSGTGCGNLPWTYKPNGKYIRRIYGNGSTRDLKILTKLPPTLGVLESNKGRSIIDGQRQRVDDEDGKLACYLRRQ